MSYRNGPYEVLVSGTQWGSFFESAHTETIDGVRQMWPVDEMTVFNVTLGYKFKNDLRVRLQVKNIEDERAPLPMKHSVCIGVTFILTLDEIIMSNFIRSSKI
ncbi:MAG: hypothetical protein CM15mP76_02150 [Prochlorococcus sp.]|nr:MAG: hypothetical protein CM15mP76_02150 [Prochlorococcus sp.]